MWGEAAAQGKQACETTAVPTVLQPQQCVVTREIGPDVINMVESSGPRSALGTERSGNASRPRGG